MRPFAADALHATHMRGSPRNVEDARWYKEWLHFCVVGPNINLLINLSIMNERTHATGAGQRARIVLVANQDREWTGDLEEVPSERLCVVPGVVDCSFGDTTLATEGGAFVLTLRPETIPITGRLTFAPVALPIVRLGTAFEGSAINWLALPRLKVSGQVTVDGRTHVLDGAMGYHDHNWGRWRWGHSLYWQWGFGLPAQPTVPWSVVFYRLLDRTRTITRAQALLLWRDQVLWKIFREGDVSIRPAGYMRPGRIKKIPAVMGLVVPELTTDVPRTVVFEGRRGDDFLNCQVENQTLAQVLVPNETDLGSTIINEVSGAVRMAGRVHGESVDCLGHSFYEHVTGS